MGPPQSITLIFLFVWKQNVNFSKRISIIIYDGLAMKLEMEMMMMAMATMMLMMAMAMMVLAKMMMFSRALKGREPSWGNRDWWEDTQSQQHHDEDNRLCLCLCLCFCLCSCLCICLSICLCADSHNAHHSLPWLRDFRELWIHGIGIIDVNTLWILIQ